MSYQAVIRDDNSVLIKSHAVGMRISILKDGSSVYVETHATSTNANGLVTIEIGGGTPVEGTFTAIDWSSGTYSIKTETDPTGGTNYPAIVGTSPLLSVPYALYAKKTGTFTETDPVFTAWDKSIDISITNTQISNWSGATSAFLTGITSGQVTTALGFTPYNSTNPAGYTSNTGTVTSVAMSTPVGLTVAGTPVTTSGTLALTLTSGYAIPTTDQLFPGFGTTTDKSANGDHTHDYSGEYAALVHDHSGIYESVIAAGTASQYWRGDKSWQPLNTDAVTEGANLYYTNARTRTAISLTTTGNSGAATYNSTSGVINIPDYTLSGLGGQPALNGTGLVRMDGTSVSYDNNTYLTSSDETDPEVGVNTTNYLPKWNGTALVTSSIYDNGNVGIGTTNPLAKLSFGDFHFPGAIPPPAEQTGTLRLYDGGDGTVIYGFGVSTNSLNIAANQAGGRIRFWTDGTERSIVNESGLNVVGTLTLNGVPVCTSSDSYWSWNPNGGGNTYLTAGQNVGIGTSSPLHKLDVVGYINTDVNFGYKMGGLTVLKAYQSNGSTVVGHYAGLNLQTDGLYNVAVGNGALQTATTGGSNTAVGNGSLYSSNSYSNSAFGSWSLYYTTSGSHNTAFGSYALYKNLIGNYNSAFGNESLNQTTGNSNVGIGHYSLLFNSSGSNNTVIGVASGRGQFGSVIQNSVLVGYAAGLNLTTGSNNLLLGYQAGDDITSGGNNIVIGYDISTPSSTTSNHLNIGNLIFGDLSAGKVGIGTATPGQKLTVAGTIESTSGGFKFPDGTVQASAATGGGGGHYVGELYGGGVVFWVDHNGDHGLICSMIDLSTSQAWSNVASTLIGPTAQSDWDGQSNTNAIIGQSGHTGSAAKLCDDYTNVDYGTGAYSDWYLPTIDDLNLLYNAKRFVSKALDSDLNGATTAITKNVYWSSTEDGDALAMSFLFVLFIGVGGGDDKANTFSVRAIRAF